MKEEIENDFMLIYILIFVCAMSVLGFIGLISYALILEHLL